MIWKDFKSFIARGNIIDLAVAVVIGGAFGTIVKTLVDEVIMPPLGLLIGKADFENMFVVLSDGPKAAPPYATLADAREAGAVTLNWGLLVNSVVAFLLIAFVVFLAVRWLHKMHRKPAPAPPDTKTCPHCATDIPTAAKRCPNCTSQL